MEKEVVDLRDLMMMIKEKKQMNANFALEFDCRIEVDDYKPLVKVINYAINYISQLTDQPMQISLNAGGNGYLLSFTAFTSQTEFPAVSEQVVEALVPYNAIIAASGDPGKYVKLLLTFSN
ncbi:MAG: hypothetical protein KDC45_11860 [Bacteroidetes bacterium]|nr:hypothetical protein [Bacteroidota bacterium]